MNSQGTIIDTIGVDAVPWAITHLSDTIFVAQLNGIMAYDDSGAFLKQWDQSISINWGAPDFATDSNGNIAIIDENGVYKLDRSQNSLIPIFIRTDAGEYSQNPRIEFISNNYLLLTTTDYSATYETIFSIIDFTTGEIIAKGRLPIDDKILDIFIPSPHQ